MNFDFDGIEDMPRALRSAAVILPEGRTFPVQLRRDTMLHLARRIEQTAQPEVRFVVVERDTSVTGWRAMVDAFWASVAVYLWIYGLIPALARIILRWLA